MTLKATEAECAAVAVAPRVRLADIEAAISARHEFTADVAMAALGHPVADPLRLLSA
jgi:hypothetical protein